MTNKRIIAEILATANVLSSCAASTDKNFQTSDMPEPSNETQDTYSQQSDLNSSDTALEEYYCNTEYRPDYVLPYFDHAARA